MFRTISWILFDRRKPNSQWSKPTCCLSHSVNTMPVILTLTYFSGFLQFVESTPVAEILRVDGTIRNFLKKHNPAENMPNGISPEVMDNYVKSCGEFYIKSSVPTYSALSHWPHERCGYNLKLAIFKPILRIGILSISCKNTPVMNSQHWFR